MPIHFTELPQQDRLVCNCNGEPFSHKLKTRVRCGECGGWLNPVAYELPEYARNLAMLNIVGVLRPYDTPMYVAGKRHYRDNPIKLTQFKRLLRPKRLRLGIEVEFESTADNDITSSHHLTLGLSRLETTYASMDRKEAEAYCILKHDGSIPGYGGEYSCIPATVPDHMAMWLRFPFGKFKTNSQSCGLHVHIDRRDISPLTIGKFHCFWNRVANVSPAQALMGRGPTDYCYVRDADSVSRIPRQTRGPRRINHTLNHKFSVVNHRHAATVELRLPRHPCSIQQLGERLSSVEASAEFLKLYSIADCVGGRTPDQMWSDFTRWCRASADNQHKLIGRVYR